MQVNIGLCYGLAPSGNKSFITWTNNDPDLCWYTASRYDNEFKLVHDAAITSITNLSHQPHYIDFYTPWLDHKTDIKTFKCMKVPIFIHDQNLLITMPAEGLAPNGARPSADTVITTYESNSII